MHHVRLSRDGPHRLRRWDRWPINGRGLPHTFSSIIHTSAAWWIFTLFRLTVLGHLLQSGRIPRRGTWPSLLLPCCQLHCFPSRGVERQSSHFGEVTCLTPWCRKVIVLMGSCRCNSAAPKEEIEVGLRLRVRFPHPS